MIGVTFIKWLRRDEVVAGINSLGDSVEKNEKTGKSSADGAQERIL